MCLHKLDENLRSKKTTHFISKIGIYVNTTGILKK